ncbi:MAG TPA: hypothetical protein VJN96_12085 [Vicinamibacterales bacterium]|nr:hypothetical protein [Vicinamibacterales bacterium]
MAATPISKASAQVAGVRTGTPFAYNDLMRAAAVPIVVAAFQILSPTLAGASPRWMAHVTFLESSDPIPNVATLAPDLNLVEGQAAARPQVFEYSEGYQTRLKIHKIASLATIPLFVAEGVVGQSLYNEPTSGKRTAHLWIATGIGVLFGVNTVTGVWNLTEARHDPNGRGRRLTHSILMLAADAGFFATAVTGPGHHFRDPAAYDSSRSLHRNLAFTSITLASVGYAIVLFPH